jgi:hypothetical protein
MERPGRPLCISVVRGLGSLTNEEYMDEFGEVMKIFKRAGQLLRKRRALNCDRQALTRQTESY